MMAARPSFTFLKASLHCCHASPVWIRLFAALGETLDLVRSDEGGALVSYSPLGASSLELDIGEWDLWKMKVLASRLLW